ncbi:MAG: biotin--[acetyl-CoA-carboxylase] ligase [Ilumatobacteraceae bacterium]
METPSATPRDSRPREWPSGWHVAVVDETGSTNADLLRAASEGAPDRTVLVARHQTTGRGRLDRRWEAPAGANLLVSMLFREIPDMPQVLTQRVGLAAIVACERVAGVRPVLKWPNDLLLEGAKLAGILAQANLGPVPAVVVGIGLNVGWAPEGAARLGGGIDPLDVLAAMLAAYDQLPDDVELHYRERLGTIGRRVRVELPDGITEGRALDLEPDGRLVVVDDCGITHRFAVGDVIHLR